MFKPTVDFKIRIKKTRKRVKNWLIYIAVWWLVALLRYLNRKEAIGMMRAIARLVYLMARRERSKTIRHLTWAFGHEKSSQEIERLSKEVFLNIAACASDAIRLPLMVQSGLDKLVTIEGYEHLKNAYAKGKGMIALTGHFGNWELLGAWAVRQGIQLKVVGREIYDPRIDAILVDIRRQAGYTNIARGKATREIIRGIQQKAAIGMLIDQDTKVEGVFVDFFGRPAHTPVGPAILARRYGCPIIPLFIRLQPDFSYHIICMQEIELQKSDDPARDLIVNTQRCSDAYEMIIRRYPEQWAWMHERWKKQPAASYR